MTRPLNAGNAQFTAGAPVAGELDVEQFGTFPIARVATIGRSPESDIVLNARSVSRHHARIFFEGNHYWIKDLESANGTRVNGKKTTLQMLADGDKVCFGEVKSVFHGATQASGPAPIAKDPLAGIDDFFTDGTPTGGIGVGRQPCAPEEASPPETVGVPKAAAGQESELRRKIEALESENERLKRTVGQLERALADANLRVRNLQDRLK